MIQRLKKIFKDTYEKSPLIHCITNPISINQCANVILSVGARPIMAEYCEEVGDITSTADALLLNLGNITKDRMKSMEISAKTAHDKNIPFIIDCVGVACSDVRRRLAFKIIQKYKPSVIKGNYSEIYAMYESSYKSAGVDSDKSLDKGSVSAVAKKLAVIFNTTVLASGKEDIITDGDKIYYIKNGSPQLSRITGTGCMLGALGASYISTDGSLDSAILACAILGIAGEKTENDGRNGTFMTELMDNISSFNINKLEDEIKWEEIQ